MTGPASIAASLTASGDSLKSDEAAPSTPAAAIQSLQRCAGDTSYEGIAGIYGIFGAAGLCYARRAAVRELKKCAYPAASEDQRHETLKSQKPLTEFSAQLASPPPPGRSAEPLAAPPAAAGEISMED